MFKSVPTLPTDVLQRTWRLIRYWLFRYSLVSTTCLLETWEAVLLHVLISIFFFLASAFNSKIVLRFVEVLSGSSSGSQMQLIYSEVCCLGLICLYTVNSYKPLSGDFWNFSEDHHVEAKSN